MPNWKPASSFVLGFSLLRLGTVEIIQMTMLIIVTLQREEDIYIGMQLRVI